MPRHRPDPPDRIQAPSEPEVVGAREFVSAPDPFEAFEPLLVAVPLFGDEGPSEMLAAEGEDGRWLTEVEAVEVDTDAGTIRLPMDRVVDVRVGNKLDEVRADRPGPRHVPDNKPQRWKGRPARRRSRSSYVLTALTSTWRI